MPVSMTAYHDCIGNRVKGIYRRVQALNVLMKFNWARTPLASSFTGTPLIR